MTLTGSVVNGLIVLDGASRLPEGTKVRVEVVDNDEDELDDFPPPPSTETYEEHLAILRQSIEEMKAGVGGVEARKFLKELAIKYNLPLLPGE
jgi:hypothetical protein